MMGGCLASEQGDGEKKLVIIIWKYLSLSHVGQVTQAVSEKMSRYEGLPLLCLG